jgi:hypothetical protein
MRGSGSIRVVGFWVRIRAWRRRWIRLEGVGLVGSSSLWVTAIGQKRTIN